MDELNEKINLDELYKKKRYQQEKRIEVYIKVLNRVHKRIKTCSNQKDNNCLCFFIVPEFILGFPRYDIATCTSFLIEKLKNNGFNIKYTHPNLLFISWQHYLPPYERKEIKKKYGVSVDGFGNVKKAQQNLKLENSNPDNLMYKPKNIKLSVTKKDDKNYKSLDKYKPTGLIYNKELLETIRDKTIK